jgi:Arrestin (or S-antigen), C-terminal domain
MLRKTKSNVVEDMQVVQIDKHELHSTWPVYNQLDTRTETRDQLTLTVTRTQSCYSPGEHVQVKATLQSNSFTTAYLRAFDFSLVETIQFRPAPKVKPIKKAGPLFKSTRIGEHRMPVNATLYGGMQQSAELRCVLSPEHIIPTVNSARNIDVSFKVVVIAQVDNVKPYSLELPIFISNWQR